MTEFTATARETAARDRSIGTIIKDLTSDISNLLRSEIALLKLEIMESVARMGTGSALLAAALFLGLAGLAFLFVTITLGMIALGLPPWLSSLIVTLVLFAAAVVLVLLGRKKFQGLKFVPSNSLEQMRSDLDTIKSDVARVRSR